MRRAIVHHCCAPHIAWIVAGFLGAALVPAVPAWTADLGVAPDRSGFMVTTGTGRVAVSDGGIFEEQDFAWDNHALRIA